MSDEIEIKDFQKFTAALDDLDSVHNPLPETAAETRRLADEAAAGAAGATGSVAAATATFLTALSGSMAASADTADAAHHQLRETTFDMRGLNGGLKEIQEIDAENIRNTPTP